MDVGSEFSITFQSFGFKRGVPMDADSVIDVRFLPNPFYDPQLRNKTGNNKEVYDYVMEKEETQQFIKYLKDYLDYVFKCYDEQNKSHMIVSIGCTGDSIGPFLSVIGCLINIKINTNVLNPIVISEMKKHEKYRSYWWRYRSFQHVDGDEKTG